MALGTTFKVEFDAKSVQRGLANLTKSFASISAKGFGNLVTPFAQLSALLAPTALVGGMYAFGKASSEAAANIENMRAQFELFTGSKSATDDLIKSLRKIAVESPLELTDISEGARNLLTYGVAADKVAPIVERLSEVSAGSAERFGRISYAFGQINSIGRLMGTELRQLTEAGFNPLENISKKTGETMIQLKKRMEDGGIGIAEVEEALRAATSEGGRFNGLNAKMAQTFTGRVSMMKDQWSQLIQSFGTGMNEGLKKAVDAIATNLPLMTEKFTSFGVIFGNAISDSVNGNFEKFKAIGKLIGDVIGSAATAAFQATAGSIWSTISNEATKLITDPMGVGDLNTGKNAFNQTQGASFSDLFDAAMINRGVAGQAADVSSGTQGIAPGTGGRFRYANPGESSAFSDGQGNKLIEIMSKIEKNTQTGSKM